MDMKKAYQKTASFRVARGPFGAVYTVKFPGTLRRLFFRAADCIPPELKRTKVALALLAGIILPLVALICSIAFISEEHS